MDMKEVLQILGTEPLLLVLVAVLAVGLVLFFRECWRNIQQERQRQRE